MKLDLKSILSPAVASPPAGPALWGTRGNFLTALQRLQPDAPAYQEKLIGLTTECVEFLSGNGKTGNGAGGSKDLNAALMLTLGLVQVDGLPGLRAGLAVIRGLCGRRFWADVHPPLIAGDARPAERRAAVVRGLWPEPGAFDAVKFKQAFWRSAADGMDQPIATVLQLKSIHPDAPPPRQQQEFQDQSPPLDNATPKEKADYAADKKAAAAAVTEAAAAAREVRESLSRVNVDRLRRVRKAAARSGRHLARLTAVFARPTAGREQLALDDFVADLTTVVQVLDKLLPPPDVKPKKPAVPNPTSEDPPSGGTPGGNVTSLTTPTPAVPAIPGEITSRRQLVQVMERVCAYFDEREPDSPLRLLTARVRHLLDRRDCLGVLRVLSADAAKAVEAAAGNGQPPPPPPA
ncbi:ImpA family type VI secretion system protein [Sphingomonas sp.]|uniref:type VI secretion system protein TssA n=1 Tax=Sphingomonas sp. TaxID=28214 RepID=UPI003B007B40